MIKILIALGVIGSVKIWILGRGPAYANVAPTIIYFLTLLGIIWYSWETRRLKDVTTKRPILSFNRMRSGSAWNIWLKNYRDGVARDVEIKLDGKPIHRIPLISSILSESNQPLPIKYAELERWKKEIVITYTDEFGSTRYRTIVKWDDAEDNRDKCKIIEYKIIG